VSSLLHAAVTIASAANAATVAARPFVKSVIARSFLFAGWPP